MTSAEKDALGRVILRELRAVEGYLRRLRAPDNEIPDIALDAALLTWRKIASGAVVLPENPGEHGPVLSTFMRKVAYNLFRARRRAGDVYVRAYRIGEPDTARHIGTYTITAKIEAWIELDAQPVPLRRFLLAFLSAGEIRAVAKALRMSKAAAEDMMRRVHGHATGKHRPPRGKNRPKKFNKP